MDEVPVFRANKRRKFARQKSEQPTVDTAVNPNQLIIRDNLDTGGESVNVAELLKWRKQNRHKGGGVQFTQHKRLDDGEEDLGTVALVTTDSEEEKLKDIANRFVCSTGQIVDVDKHMMAYIDSEMAKRHRFSTTLQQQEQEQLSLKEPALQNVETPLENKVSRPKVIPEYRPRNQLSEFDLGPDAQQINLARTEAAIARAKSGLPPQPATAEERQPRKPRKPRLGRDGKPLRPRPRKRRNSEDIARDALVEQVLHENKVDVYEASHEADAAESHDEEDDDEAADERLAERFRRQFMDAVAERRMKKQGKSTTAAKAKSGGHDQPSGPKLGGSRSARAKMAQWQQQQKSALGKK